MMRQDAAMTVETRIGRLGFTHDFANGYPTRETVDKLYDERDFQRAVQAYVWAMPLVAFGGFKRVLMEREGAAWGDEFLPGNRHLANTWQGEFPCIRFGPTEPKAAGANWIKTIPGRGYFIGMRLYAPTQAFFDKQWKPDDIVKVK